MENHWAAEHLQVIRTLMERAAVYRRALGPIMAVVGALGLIAAAIGLQLQLETPRGFTGYWMAVSCVAVLTTYLLVRQQALKAEETFWSPPTRRVTQALLPAFFAGLVVSCGVLEASPPAVWLLPAFWLVLYGCALHAAGFFMPRGIKLFAWIMLLAGLFWFFVGRRWPELQTARVSHLVMGAAFGGLQLAYGIYLYFTEKQRVSL